MFVKHLLCTQHCSGNWKYSGVQENINKLHLSWNLHLNAVDNFNFLQELCKLEDTALNGVGREGTLWRSLLCQLFKDETELAIPERVSEERQHEKSEKALRQ